MEYLLGAISLISLVVNVLIYRKITDAVKPVYFDITVEPLPPEPEPEAVVEEPVPPVTVPMVQEVYQGWRNQQGLPWTEPVSSPQPVKQAPVKGPLERPDGFV